MSTNNQDDDFGGFEEAVDPVKGTSSFSQVNSNNNNNTATSKKPTDLPDWLLPEQTNNRPPTAAYETNVNQLIKSLQDELSMAKEQLIDHQTSYLQLQTQHRQEVEEKTLAFDHSISIVYKECQNMMREQREAINKDMRVALEQHKAEHERRLNEKIREMSEKFENRLLAFQENLIKHYESEFEDVEVKVRKTMSGIICDEQSKEMQTVKQSIERLERDLRAEIEKHMQSYFMSQSEVFKESIKSGIAQEHLIHKDMINSKLEKLFKASEEKRRKTNLIFARHMSGLNFFVDNAHKQLSILKECQQELMKNKEIADYYCNGNNNNNQAGATTALVDEVAKINMTASLYSLSLSANGNNNDHNPDSTRSVSKDNLFDMYDEHLVDENLLNDI